MKILKLAAIPAALVATSAFAAPIVVDQQVVAQPVGVSTTTYDPNAGIVQNTTTQVVNDTKTFFGTVTHPASVSAEVGSLGYGANIAWSANDKTEVVAGWNGGNVKSLYGKDFKARGVKYDIDKADLSNPYVGLRVRPAANWFTVETGAIIPDNDVKIKTDDTSGTFKVDGDVYKLTPGSKLSGTIDHRNDIAPYLTFGFHPNINNHWGLFGDIGAAYMGKTDASIQGTGTVTNQSNGTTESASYVASKAESDIKDKNWGEWAPIVKLGATYRF